MTVEIEGDITTIVEDDGQKLPNIMIWTIGKDKVMPRHIDKALMRAKLIREGDWPNLAS